MASIRFGKEEVGVEAGRTIADALSSMGRFPDTFIFLMEGRPVPMTSVISDDDEIEAVRIASGG